MLYIISNCTNSKKLTPNKDSLFRNYTNNITNNIVLDWKTNLLNSNNKIKAKDLYKGVTWKATLDCENEFSIKFPTKLLIASAGYGLIDSEKIISSYGITFSKNQLDSINKYCLNEVWWNNINEFPVNKFKNVSAIFICLSKEYLNATDKYIDKLIKIYSNKVFIINISKKCELKFKNNYLNFDSRFNLYEPGTLINLSQRALRWLSKEIVENKLELNQNILQEHINTFLNNFENTRIKKGKKIEDTDLRIILSDFILKKHILSASKGLTLLREKGISCEQKRFHHLFNNLKKEIITNEK